MNPTTAVKTELDTHVLC